jgi:plasmid replication initiation protein
MNMNDLVVNDNSLINASYSLALIEQRLILLAIVEARKTGKGMNASESLVIHADSYAMQFNVVKQASYKALKDACDNLFERRFSYQERTEKGIKNIKSRWVSQIAYIDNTATVELIFSPAVVPLVTQLEKQFTRYELEQVSNLKSAYAVRLYELLIAWRSLGKVPMIELQDFRQKIGVLDYEYKLIADFKKRVLDVALKQVNEHTDITVSYEQHKQGRVITGFSFTFKFKKPAKAEKQKALEHAKDPDPHTEKREAYAQFVGYQQRAKLLNEPIENLITKKELAQFRKFEFMK